MFATIEQINFNNCKSGVQKSGECLNSILKNQTEKLIKNGQTASQETQSSNLSKRRENCWTCAKKPAKLSNLRVYTLIKDNFRWSKNSIKIILVDTGSGLNFLKARP